MRRAVLLLSAAAVLMSGAVQAENRVFIVANADGYGVDRCLSTGHACGQPIATAYCRAREFDRALSFRKVAPDEVTGTIPAGTRACRGPDCNEFVAIECAR
jgi:hypothetical protein